MLEAWLLEQSGTDTAIGQKTMTRRSNSISMTVLQLEGLPNIQQIRFLTTSPLMDDACRPVQPRRWIRKPCLQSLEHELLRDLVAQAHAQGEWSCLFVLLWKSRIGVSIAVFGVSGTSTNFEYWIGDTRSTAVAAPTSEFQGDATPRTSPQGVGVG